MNRSRFTRLATKSLAIASVLSIGLLRPASAQTTYSPYRITTIAGTYLESGSADGSGNSARFNYAFGVAVDAADNVYVADSGNDVVRKITPQGLVTTLAGTASSGGYTDGTGAAAKFNDPYGVAVDAAGNVFVADLGNSVIRRITPNGVVTTYAGIAGPGGYQDGPAASAKFNRPGGIAVDAVGNVFVADTGNALIRKIAPNGTVSTVAGTLGSIGSADGANATAKFYTPYGVAVDANGNVYVADTGNDVIRVITPAGLVTTVAGAGGSIGSADGTGVGAHFNAPMSVSVDAAGNVYVADSRNYAVRRIAPGGVVTTVAGLPGIQGNMDGVGPKVNFQEPSGVAATSDGSLYVADGSANIVRVGHPVTLIPATVTLGNLDQKWTATGYPTVTTVPAGLQTIVTYTSITNGYSTTSESPPYDEFANSSQTLYTVTAAIADPYYTGSASGVLNYEPYVPAEPTFTVQHAAAGGSFLWGITAGPSGLVAVGTNGAVLTSKDGSNWPRQYSGTSNWLVAVTYGGGQYVAVGDGGTILVSADGATWTSVSQTATAQRLNNVIYAAGQYVAVGEAGTIITSPDGQKWTAQVSGVTGWLRGLAYAAELNYSNEILPRVIPARFVATGQGGAIISSTDGVTWSNDGVLNGRGPLTASEDLEALISTTTANYEAVGDNGAQAFSVTDGQGVTPGPYLILGVSSLPVPVVFRGLVQTPNALIAVGENGTILSSAGAGHTWTQIPSGTVSDLVAAVAIGDTVYIVGSSETIVESSVPNESRLANLSCRTQVGTGGNILIAGFAVGGQGTSGTIPLLVRASGPALIPFNVPGTLPDPELKLYSTSFGTSLIASNSGWGGSSAISSAAAQVGAFAWADPNSPDAAVLTTLSAGPYTANVSGASNSTGIALAEVYDATPSRALTASAPRLVNLSARAEVGTGGNVLIAGFVIEGITSKTVLVRASGPALAAFGVQGTLPDPSIQIYSAYPSGQLMATNAGWNGDSTIATASGWVGAFSWGTSPTNDSAVLITLPPGPYTANVSGASGDSGVALVEIYEVQ